MTGVVIGLIIGAALIGVPAARYQRTTRARADWVGAARVHRAVRKTFWRELGGLLAAGIPTVIVLAVLYWIGSR